MSSKYRLYSVARSSAPSALPISSTEVFTSFVSSHLSTMTVRPFSSSCWAVSSLMVMHRSGSSFSVASMSTPSAVSSTGPFAICGANLYCMAHLSFFVKFAGISFTMRLPLPMHSTNAFSTPTEPNVAMLFTSAGTSTVRPAMSVTVRVAGCACCFASSPFVCASPPVLAQPAKPTQPSETASATPTAPASQLLLVMVLIMPPFLQSDGCSFPKRRVRSTFRQAKECRF